MGITSLQELDTRGVTTTKPRQATIEQTSPVTFTYYTIVDATSAKGILSRVSVHSFPLRNNNYSIRITIDGTEHVISGGNENNATRGINRYDNNANGTNVIDLWQNVTFTKSLKVEVRKTASSEYSLHGTVDYSLV